MINIGNKTVLDIGIGGKAVQKIEIDDKIAYEMPDYLCFTDVSGSANTLSLTKTGTAPTVNLEYSTDKNTWNAWTETEGVRSVTIPANGKVWLRGDNENGFAVDGENCHKFTSTGYVNADGDLMRIINKNGTNTIPTQGFVNLFRGMTTLKKAPSIEANVFNTRCCATMFQGCTQMNDLSNLVLNNITFPSGSNYQFVGMFMGCRFTQANNLFNNGVLPILSGAYNQMFAFNTNLTTSPEFTINDNIIGSAIQQMFQNCSSLSDISKIHFNSTYVASWSMSSMFTNCTSLQTGIDLRSITSMANSALSTIYKGCINLNVAYAPTMAWDTTKTPSWLNNVASSGTLYADASISSTIPTNSVDGCPSGWTVQNI